MPAGRPRQSPEERKPKLISKLLSLSPDAARAFDILKAEQGSRSGPRLAGEAIDLLLKRYGKEPVGPLKSEMEPARPVKSPGRGSAAQRKP